MCINLVNGRIIGTLCPAQLEETYDILYKLGLDIVNFPCRDGDVSSSPSYGTYLSQLIGFARVCNAVEDVYDRNSIISSWVFSIINVDNHLPYCITGFLI